MADEQSPPEVSSPPEIPEQIPPPLDGSPVLTQPPPDAPTPWVPKTVAEHNAWVASLKKE